MPKASKGTASETVEVEGYEGHLEKAEGGYTIAFETYTADTDLSPFLTGCRTINASARTGGYVIKEKVLQVRRR